MLKTIRSMEKIDWGIRKCIWTNIYDHHQVDLQWVRQRDSVSPLLLVILIYWIAKFKKHTTMNQQTIIGYNNLQPVETYYIRTKFAFTSSSIFDNSEILHWRDSNSMSINRSFAYNWFFKYYDWFCFSTDILILDLFPFVLNWCNNQCHLDSLSSGWYYQHNTKFVSPYRLSYIFFLFSLI